LDAHAVRHGQSNENQRVSAEATARKLEEREDGLLECLCFPYLSSSAESITIFSVQVGMVGESPQGFIRGILNFRQRKQWESMFEDGIVVENIDTGELVNSLIHAGVSATPNEKGPSKGKPNKEPSQGGGGGGGGGGIGSTIFNGIRKMALPDSATKQRNVVRTTDDVVAFLQTVDLAGAVLIP
jgi:hypothetical protein